MNYLNLITQTHTQGSGPSTETGQNAKQNFILRLHCTHPTTLNKENIFQIVIMVVQYNIEAPSHFRLPKAAILRSKGIIHEDFI